MHSFTKWRVCLQENLLKWNHMFWSLQGKKNFFKLKYCLKALKTAICFCIHFYNSAAAHWTSSISSFPVDHSLLQGFCDCRMEIFMKTLGQPGSSKFFKNVCLAKSCWQAKCAPTKVSVSVYASSVYSICKCGQRPKLWSLQALNEEAEIHFALESLRTCQSYPFQIILMDS